MYSRNVTNLPDFFADVCVKRMMRTERKKEKKSIAT